MVVHPGEVGWTTVVASSCSTIAGPAISTPGRSRVRSTRPWAQTMPGTTGTRAASLPAASSWMSRVGKAGVGSVPTGFATACVGFHSGASKTNRLSAVQPFSARRPSFEPGDGDVETGPIARLDVEPLLVRPHELARKRDRAEPLPAEPEGPRGRTGEEVELLKHRVRLPVELERGVVAENGITGEAGGQKAGVHRGSPRVRAGGHHGAEPSAQLEQVARPHVVAKESVHGLRRARATGPQMRRQLGPREDWMGGEECQQVRGHGPT